MTRCIAMLLFFVCCVAAPGQHRARTRHPRRSNRESYLWTAACRDGTHTFAKAKHGACSHHGGVAHWIVNPAN